MAQLERIAASFKDVVDECTNAREGKGAREKNHVAKLYHHLQIIFDCILKVTEKQQQQKESLANTLLRAVDVIPVHLFTIRV